MIELERREFDSLKRAGEIAEALGDIVPELLGSLSVVANPYYLATGSVGTATRYTINVQVKRLSDGAIFDKVVGASTNGTESSAEDVLDMIVNTVGKLPELHLQAYTEDSKNQYLTLVAKEGYKIHSQPILNNLTTTTDQVQASTGKPAAYVGMQKHPTNPYPRLVVTPMPVVSVDDKFKRGSIKMNVGGKDKWVPFTDSYIKASFKVTVESGQYDEVVEKGRSSAETILRRIKTKLGIEKYHTDFIKKVDGTLDSKWSITSSPQVEATGFYNTASVTMTLDIIDRYVELDDGYGGIITKVIIKSTADLRHEGNKSGEIFMGQTIERTDIP